MFLTVLTYIAIGLLAILAIFYLGLEVRFYRALGRVREGFADPEPLPKVSILIAARNESEGIRETLDSAPRTTPRRFSRNTKQSLNASMCSRLIPSPKA